ncbi:hypothetical protein JKY72_03720 [Candidatus Gracilibacteria bacterium]|nr:hypothetical protein [Candidatus Gracilibacteria bacterium]
MEQVQPIIPGTTVSPTLSGLNITGDIKNDSGRVKINDAVDITGTILNSSTTNNGSVRIGDNLWLSGPVANESTTQGGKVKIDDELWVTGNSQLDGSLDVDTIDSSGAVLSINKTNGLGVQIGDNAVGDGAGLTVYGSLLVKEVATCNPVIQDCVGASNTGGGIVLESGLSTPSITTSKLIAKDGNAITIEGIVDFGDTALNLGGGGDTFIQASGDNIVLHATENSSSDIELLPSDKVFLGGNTDIGTSNAKKDLRVYGHVKADSIGKFNRVTPSSFYSISGNGLVEKSVSCPTGQVLVSCSGQASYSTNYGGTSYVYFTNIDPYGNTCYVRAKNTHTATKYFKPIAICFDPDGK